MSSVIEETQQRSQLRILVLEKEKGTSYNETSLKHNLNVIDNVLTEKKNNIQNNSYSNAAPLAAYYDIQLVTHLEAIYNILHILDNRLSKLEKYFP